MSTRSCIARPHGDGWEGRYHHSDGYPSGLGAELWAQVQQQGVERMRQVLIRDHTGWSNILGADWSKAPGFGGDGDAPNCYCHGDRAEEGWWIRDSDEKGNCALHIEWVYVLSDYGMTVYASRAVPNKTHRTRGTRTDGSKYSFSSPRYTWAHVGDYPWSGPEPKWETLEKEPEP